jgi:hypothetical protein
MSDYRPAPATTPAPEERCEQRGDLGQPAQSLTTKLSGKPATAGAGLTAATEEAPKHPERATEPAPATSLTTTE